MIESWLQDLVGIPYSDHGDTPEHFSCSGIAQYIYRQRFGLDLPDDPVAWRKKFDDLGWPTPVQPYDVVLMSSEQHGLHMGIAADAREVIHADYFVRQVIITPIARMAPLITNVYRLKNAA